MGVVWCFCAGISAAFHPPEGDTNASTKALLWGVVDKGSEDNTGTAIGHCSFTSFEVTAPVEGQLYA